MTRERVIAGLVAAKRRVRRGGCPHAIDEEKLQQIIAALESGASKASVCRAFGVARYTLGGALGRSPILPTTNMGALS